jgi:hypothetical protein
MHSARLLMLLTNLALFAGWVGKVKHFGPTWSDGH